MDQLQFVFDDALPVDEAVLHLNYAIEDTNEKCYRDISQTDIIYI